MINNFFPKSEATNPLKGSVAGSRQWTVENWGLELGPERPTYKNHGRWRRSMKQLLPLAVFLLLSGCLSGGASWERVDVEGFEEALANEENGFLLDVRTASEWEQDGHLENATLIPHTELESRENELPEDKDTPLLLYCRSGNRSQQAAQTLQDMGFANIIELESGITGWKNAGNPVVYG